MLNRFATQWFGVIVCLMSGLVAASTDVSGPSVLIDCTTPSQVIAISAEAGVLIRSSAASSLFVRVEERGDRLVLSAGADLKNSISEISVPYRYGMHLVRLAPAQELHVQRVATTMRRATARLVVDCSTVAVSVQRRDWLWSVAAIAAPLDSYSSTLPLATLLSDIERVATSADTPFTVALALHVRAQILLVSGRNADSVVAFADAAKAWRAADDEPRARVALVGEVEDLQRLARHSETLNLVGEVALPDDDYFSARLQMSRCLSLRYLGRMREALHCFDVGVGAMDRLGETPDLVSALQDMADVSRFLGDVEGARKLGLRALRQSTLPQMETQRGRIHSMLGDIALEEGDVATAVREFDLALTEFVASGSLRWQANALLQAAQLYASLGALEEASAFISSALEKLSERDAAARVAAARVVQADIDRRRSRPDLAREGLAKAAKTYAQRDMPADLDSTRLAQSWLALGVGDAATAAEHLANRDNQQRLNAIDWELLALRVDAAQGRCASATKALRRLERKLLSIDRELERVIASADCLVADGERDAAQRLLITNAHRIIELAQKVSSPLLRQMLASKIEPLRNKAFRLAAHSASAAAKGTLDPEIIWRWLRMDDAPQAHTVSPSAGIDATRFDAEVASELLSRQTQVASIAAASRQLLGMLAVDPMHPIAPVHASSELSLFEFQQRLGDAVFVTYVDAGEHSQLLWIRRDSVRLQSTLDASHLRTATDTLLAAIRRSATPIQAIDDEARKLSNALLAAESDTVVPARLLVDATSSLAAFPWSVLSWPGSSQPLLETTRVSIVRMGDGTVAARSPASEVAVFVADQGSSRILDALWNADAEPSLVAEGIAANDGRVRRIAGNDRGALLDAFAEPHGWLHVAAHGDARASQIGYAGIWLDAQANSAVPTFFSWVDILARGSHSDLVVLNACALADKQGNQAATLSFADAVSRAGARDVVAARWQVSDAATALWVPLFYRQVTQGATPAEAVWQIRRQLHDSRRFRHPFYWAAWVHFGNI